MLQRLQKRSDKKEIFLLGKEIDIIWAYVSP